MKKKHYLPKTQEELEFTDTKSVEPLDVIIKVFQYHGEFMGDGAAYIREFVRRGMKALLLQTDFVNELSLVGERVFLNRKKLPSLLEKIGFCNQYVLEALILDSSKSKRVHLLRILWDLAERKRPGSKEEQQLRELWSSACSNSWIDLPGATVKANSCRAVMHGIQLAQDSVGYWITTRLVRKILTQYYKAT